MDSENAFTRQAMAATNQASAEPQQTPPPVPPPVPNQPAPAPQPPRQPQLPDPLVPNFTPDNSYNEQPPKKRRRALPILILVIAIALIAGFAVSAFGVFSSFSNITYDNNNGSSYKLDFYRDYEVQKLSTNLAPQYAGEVDRLSDGTKKLVSDKAKDNNSPLTIAIWKAKTNSPALGLKNCTSDMPRVMTVRDDNTNSDVKLCVLRDDGKDIVYAGVLTDGNTNHIITIVQDLPFDDVKDARTAQALYAKTNLAAYKDDIKTIVSSIDPQ